jgi:carbon-monoxide dehydrogenase small subunit
MLLTALELLESNANPSREDIRDALGGNLCRCTGYQTIVDAVELAARRMAAPKAASAGAATAMATPAPMRAEEVLS